MRTRPQVTSAEEPDGGNPHIRFWRGLGLGNRPGLLDNSRRSRLRAETLYVTARCNEGLGVCGPLRSPEKPAQMSTVRKIGQLRPRSWQGQHNSPRRDQ
jgi:hypothetical protein